jgi:hypothetical protein
MRCHRYPEVDVSVVVVTAKDPCVRSVTLTSSITGRHVPRMTATDSEGQDIRISLREREREGERECILCMLSDGGGGRDQSDTIQILGDIG